jgi:hypothetical protein
LDTLTNAQLAATDCMDELNAGFAVTYAPKKLHAGRRDGRADCMPSLLELNRVA